MKMLLIYLFMGVFGLSNLVFAQARAFRTGDLAGSVNTQPTSGSTIPSLGYVSREGIEQNLDPMLRSDPEMIADAIHREGSLLIGIENVNYELQQARDRRASESEIAAIERKHRAYRASRLSDFSLRLEEMSYNIAAPSLLDINSRDIIDDAKARSDMRAVDRDTALQAKHAQAFANYCQTQVANGNDRDYSCLPFFFANDQEREQREVMISDQGYNRLNEALIGTINAYDNNPSMIRNYLQNR